eukprot:TRINITY_DN1567_c0_g1_i6.p1 TRINITY_DN1567_c0_g1~~TRINITY_DN1567_c0_g1_i6.p1  ORF type:complete len:158 (+),score=25.69 TRINITY_DN1567_c0_g1_i6:46-519(+)
MRDAQEMSDREECPFCADQDCFLRKEAQTNCGSNVYQFYYAELIGPYTIQVWEESSRSNRVHNWKINLYKEGRIVEPKKDPDLMDFTQSQLNFIDRGLTREELCHFLTNLIAKFEVNSVKCPESILLRASEHQQANTQKIEDHRRDESSRKNSWFSW